MRYILTAVLALFVVASINQAQAAPQGLDPENTVIMELKTGKVLFCKSCGRLMYLRPVDAA